MFVISKDSLSSRLSEAHGEISPLTPFGRDDMTAVPEPVEGFFYAGCLFHILSMAGINYRNSIIVDCVGEVPFIVIGHVVTFPTFNRWFAS